MRMSMLSVIIPINDTTLFALTRSVCVEMWTHVVHIEKIQPESHVIQSCYCCDWHRHIHAFSQHQPRNRVASNWVPSTAHKCKSAKTERKHCRTAQAKIMCETINCHKPLPIESLNSFQKNISTKCVCVQSGNRKFKFNFSRIVWAWAHSEYEY